MLKESSDSIAIAVFHNRIAAENCFAALLGRGYLSSDINVMMTERTRRLNYASDGQNDGTTISSASHMQSVRISAEGAETVNADQAVMGATLVAIASTGKKVVIPGLTLIIAGPMLTSRTSGDGATIGGLLVGSLADLGVPHENVVVCHRALQEGAVVLAVEGRSESAQNTKGDMIHCGGENVCCCNC